MTRPPDASPVDERLEASALLASTAPRGRLRDRGFAGQAWKAMPQARGRNSPVDCFSAPVERLTVVLTPGRTARRLLPAAVRRPVAVLRNRIETTIGELTERLGLARHGARTFWGRLPRTAQAILAHTLLRLRLV